MQIGNFQIGAEVRKTAFRMLSALLAILLMLYAFYHFTTGAESEVETMLVTEDTVETVFSGEAVLFRHEIPVGDTHTGLTLPLVSSGAHVAKDTEIVSVCVGGEEHRALYRSLSEYIVALEAADAEGDVLADLSALQAELRETALSLTERCAHARGIRVG